MLNDGKLSECVETNDALSFLRVFRYEEEKEDGG